MDHVGRQTVKDIIYTNTEVSQKNLQYQVRSNNATLKPRPLSNIILELYLSDMLIIQQILIMFMRDTACIGLIRVDLL